MSRITVLVGCWLAVTACGAAEHHDASDESEVAASVAEANVPRRLFYQGARYLVVEALSDDLLHFEMAGAGSPDVNRPIYATPMVARTQFPGPTTFQADAASVETRTVRAEIAADLCVKVIDKVNDVTLQTLCPRDLESPWKSLAVDSPETRNVYGLGQYFAEEATDGDWMGRVWDPLFDGYGAKLRGFAGGANNFSMFPIMYALGDGKQGYGFFLDQVYKQMWDFRGAPWTLGMWGDQIRWYIFRGDDLPSLRRSYMDLTGHPPVPPKANFGLWVSEFGFLNFNEVKTALADLRAARIPVDGFALDLQWFGGTFGDPDHSRMGSLAFDPRTFPDAANEVRKFAEDDGVKLMLIEEPYVSETLPEYQEMAGRHYLARSCATCGPAYLNYNPWWGRGGMVDFTSPEGSAFWHDYRREALISLGITNHWADLGEPEQFLATSWYHGFPELGKHDHADVHNIYGFKWMQSIADGYARNNHAERPFMLSRTGTAGIQRFGAGLWSGDIGSNWGNLKSQMQVQAQMSMSGVDYYGSDVGGFQRNTTVPGGERLYTQWFADSAMLDVPVRPHAWNLDKQRATSPAKRGELKANTENIRLRYRLAPYYYSLAFRAHLFGEPVFPPLVHAYQGDANVRRLGSQKMIGKDLLVAVAADPDATSREVYFPSGDWVDFQTLEWVHSQGQAIRGYSLYTPGYLQLPLFARGGAIIPMARIDEGTWNMLGRRTGGARSEALDVRVFASALPTTFDVYEDDGTTVAYKSGAYAVTNILQELAGDEARVAIDGTTNRYEGLPASREHTVEIVHENRLAQGVTLNGVALASCQSATQAACYTAVNGSTQVRTGARPIDQRKEIVVQTAVVAPRAPAGSFVCKNATTRAGQAVYAIGDAQAVGAWDLARAVKLTPTAPPTWSARIEGLPANGRVTWKCIVRNEDGSGAPTWQAGGDNVLATGATGYAGESAASF